jgi:hypothetical protein
MFRAAVAQIVQEKGSAAGVPTARSTDPIRAEGRRRGCLGDERDSHSARRATLCVITKGCNGFKEFQSALLLLSHPRAIVSDTRRA